MWGRRRKSPSSHSPTDGFHMGLLGGGGTSGSSNPTAVNRPAAAFDIIAGEPL